MAGIGQLAIPIATSLLGAGASFFGGRQAAKQRKELLGKFGEEERFQRGIEAPLIQQLLGRIQGGVDVKPGDLGPQLTELQRQSRFALAPALQEQQRLQSQGLLTPGAITAGLGRFQRTAQRGVLGGLVNLLNQRRAENIQRQQFATQSLQGLLGNRFNRFQSRIGIEGQAGTGASALGTELLGRGLEGLFSNLPKRVTGISGVNTKKIGR